MSLTFPASPSTGDTYTASNNTWYWDGTKWRTYGIQGAIGPAGATGTAGNDLPKITAVTYADSGYTSNGASNVPATGGYIYLTGSNFQSGCSVYVNGTLMTTTYVSSTRVNVAITAQSAAYCHIYFYNPDGGTTVKVNGIVYAPPGSGGTITNSGSYTIHTFISSGTFTLLTAKTVDYLIVAGGGGGGASRYSGGGGGGGGAGGLIYLTSQSMATGTTYTVTVGAGGLRGTSTTSGSGAHYNGTTGNDSSIVGGAINQVAIGGGGGGYTNYALPGTSLATSGGSGGGSGSESGQSGAAGTSGQGNAGGTGVSGGNYPGGGGGGAGAAGSNGDSPVSGQGGAGGIGLQYSISGSAVYYAGGGSGGSFGTATAGSLGGGGAGGGGTYNNGSNGTDRLGGGGGGAGGYAQYGGTGGDGVVIIRYLT